MQSKTRIPDQPLLSLSVADLIHAKSFLTYVPVYAEQEVLDFILNNNRTSPGIYSPYHWMQLLLVQLQGNNKVIGRRSRYANHRTLRLPRLNGN